MTLAAWVLWGAALAFGGVGAAFLADPSAMGAAVGIGLEGATADNDVRAVYGGLGLGIAVFLAAGALRGPWTRPALFAVITTLGGMATARFVSWAAVGLPEPIGYALHAAELVGLVLGAAAYRRLGAG